MMLIQQSHAMGSTPKDALYNRRSWYRWRTYALYCLFRTRGWREATCAIRFEKSSDESADRRDCRAEKSRWNSRCAKTIGV